MQLGLLAGKPDEDLVQSCLGERVVLQDAQLAAVLHPSEDDRQLGVGGGKLVLELGVVLLLQAGQGQHLGHPAHHLLRLLLLAAHGQGVPRAEPIL